MEQPWDLADLWDDPIFREPVLPSGDTATGNFGALGNPNSSASLSMVQPTSDHLSSTASDKHLSSVPLSQPVQLSDHPSSTQQHSIQRNPPVKLPALVRVQVITPSKSGALRVSSDIDSGNQRPDLASAGLPYYVDDEGGHWDPGNQLTARVLKPRISDTSTHSRKRTAAQISVVDTSQQAGYSFHTAAPPLKRMGEMEESLQDFTFIDPQAIEWAQTDTAADSQSTNVDWTSFSHSELCKVIQRLTKRNEALERTLWFTNARTPAPMGPQRLYGVERDEATVLNIQTSLDTLIEKVADMEILGQAVEPVRIIFKEAQTLITNLAVMHSQAAKFAAIFEKVPLVDFSRHGKLTICLICGFFNHEGNNCSLRRYSHKRVPLDDTVIQHVINTYQAMVKHSRTGRAYDWVNRPVKDLMASAKHNSELPLDFVNNFGGRVIEKKLKKRNTPDKAKK